jgi:hypothetical protein
MQNKTEQLDLNLVVKLKKIQEEQNNIVISLGQITVQKRQLLKSIEDLEKRELTLGESLDKSIEVLNKELAEIDGKYPNGQIDLEKGIITY